MARYDLGLSVRKSFDFLKEKFGADSTPRPVIVIDQSPNQAPASYNPGRNILFLQTNDMEKLNSIGLHYAIGEEVSHYLHYQVNPWLLDANRALADRVNSAKEEKEKDSAMLDYFILYNFIEFVGSYGALLYVEKCEGGKIAKDMGGELIKNLESFMGKEDEAVAKHGIGYLVGFGAYCGVGDGYLRAASRINSFEQIKPIIMHPEFDSLKNLLETKPIQS